jgi:hypothetical protein
MSLTALILMELGNGPATRYELAERIKAGPRYMENTLLRMKREKQIAVVGKGMGPDGRSTRLYALPEYVPPQVPEVGKEPPTVDSGSIADNEYAIATRRTYANIIFPGAGSRRGL